MEQQFAKGRVEDKCQPTSSSFLRSVRPENDRVARILMPLQPEQIPKEGVVRRYKHLLEVEDAFCHLKSYLRVHRIP